MELADYDCGSRNEIIEMVETRASAGVCIASSPLWRPGTYGLYGCGCLEARCGWSDQRWPA